MGEEFYASKALGLVEGRKIRGLTLHRPWPWAFTHADKRVENRAWHPPRWLVGGWLALHAGKHFDAQAVEHFRDGLFTADALSVPVRKDDHPHSVIVAVAWLRGFYERADNEPMRDLWSFGPFCWVLPKVHVLPAPVPCRGAQGLWTLPPDVFIAVREQLAQMGGPQ